MFNFNSEDHNENELAVINSVIFHIWVWGKEAVKTSSHSFKADNGFTWTSTVYTFEDESTLILNHEYYHGYDLSRLFWQDILVAEHKTTGIEI